MTFDAALAIAAAQRVYPEPLSLPEELQDATTVELAAARNALAEVTAIATELRKIVDGCLAADLEDSAMEYGGSVYRPAGGRGTAKLTDAEAFWNLVAEVNGERTTMEAGAVLLALCPPNIRLTALPKLLDGSGYNLEAIRDTFIAYDPPSSVLSVMPVAKSPKFLQDLAEGEIRKLK